MESETDGSQSVDLALSVAEYFHINMKEAKIIVEKVSCAVKNWRNIAKSLNISNREIELMENAFRL
jgi:serine/threonine-protein kinase HipA